MGLQREWRGHSAKSLARNKGVTKSCSGLQSMNREVHAKCNALKTKDNAPLIPSNSIDYRSKRLERTELNP
jgi:hypothetical protein